LKIGPATQPTTGISGSNPETIVIRGHDLVGDLIGRISFTDHVWLLVCGTLPNAAQRRILDATLVAIAEHGLVPSVQAARMTLAAAPEALQGAVAAGLLGCGSVILGASEAAGRLFSEVVALHENLGGALDRRRAKLSAVIAAKNAPFRATATRCTRASIRVRYD
jgi:citrate synthase